MDVESYRKKVEKQILVLIKEKLEKGEMKADRAKDIAKMVLEKLPSGIDLKDFYKIVPTLDDHFYELASIVLPVVKEYEEKVEKAVINSIEKMVKAGNFQQVSELIKKTIKKDLEI